MKKVDILIIGQGIAGTVLSHQLIQKGYSVFVIDHKKVNSASRIAAGVYNPIAYRKLKRAEFVEFLLPSMQDYYGKLQKELNVSFFKPSSFLKLLTDIEELNNWQIQCAKESNTSYMSKTIFTSNFNHGIKNEIGAGQVLNSGVVKIPTLIEAWQKRLIESHRFSSGPFNYSDLEFHTDGIHYSDMCYEKVIFTEGVGVSKNPWFNWLPIQKFKGEVLEIHAPNLELDRMINRGVFLLPLGNGYFKVGATHDWRKVDEVITTEGRLELTDKLDKFINVPYTVVKHEAGLRPAARDRHPYIGVHPENNRLFVFNGLGSKGVIMAPWLVTKFIEGLDSFEWPPEFDIKRYIRFFNDSNTGHEKN